MLTGNQQVQLTVSVMTKMADKIIAARYLFLRFAKKMLKNYMNKTYSIIFVQYLINQEKM